MGPVRATLGRTVGRARSLFSTAFAFGGFLAVSAALLARQISLSDGSAMTLPVLWATSVSPVLPMLAALLGMDVWSDERLSGRIDLMLSVPVREADYVLGKFFGVWSMLMSAVLLSLAATLLALRLLAPEALSGVGAESCAVALLAPVVQGALWSAAVVALSAMFRHASSTACAAALLLVAVPRGLWWGVLSWSDAGRTAFGEMPLDAHAVDLASGVLPVGTVAIYLTLTVLSLFVSARSVACCRLIGRGAARLRWSTGFALFLSFLLAGLLSAAFVRVTAVADLSSGGVREELSPRTRSILSEASGTVSITAFLSRSDPAARAAMRVMRALKRQSEVIGGVRIETRFVDPRWDVGAAGRLVRRGAKADSLVFEKGRKMVSLPIAEGVGERVCAATIRRISVPARRRNVYWTVGHGESRFDDYGAFGLSDIARDLFREGFGNQTLDLSESPQVPGDCALVVIAGARDDFQRAETDKLNAYLRDGGRLLVLLSSAKTGGVVSLLPSWGLSPAEILMKNVKTLSGTDVVVTGLSDHPISEPLAGSRIVLEKPVCFRPSSLVQSGTGADRIEFSPVAAAGTAAVVAAAERGGKAGQDLALRPTRIVALGDAGFVLNGQLASRACANRDFFLNCVSYLSGAEAHGAGDAGVEVFRSGLDRTGRLRHAVWTVGVVPFAVFLVLLVVAARRRHRS